MTPDDIPNYGDPNCPHSEEDQIPNGMGTICSNCGVLQVRWR